MTTPVKFVVYGKAVPSALRPVPLRRAGQVIGSRLAPGRDKEAEKRILAWQSQVAERAAMAMHPREPMDGPVVVHLTFYRQRPKTHMGTGRNAGKVKPSAPRFPISAPDLLKTARLVEDSLSGIVYRDDAQIVEEQLGKRYGTPRCEVVVWPVNDDREARDPDAPMFELPDMDPELREGQRLGEEAAEAA